MLVGKKSITTMQDGGVYKERWTSGWNDPFPMFNASAVTEFYDSAGGLILSIDGVVSDREVTFLEQPEVVAVVPNGAGFRVVLTDDEGPHVIRYGTVFRRQLFFPNSPAEVLTFEPKRYTDTFQRPPGGLGGRWRTLLGRPLIFDNTGTIPNSVGPDYPFYSRYFTRYYQPFTGESVELSISCIDKGSGTTVVAICCNYDASSFLYASFHSASGNQVRLGFGTNKDITSQFGLQPQVGPVSLTIPSNAVANYKMRYDDATKEMGLYNSDKTVKYLSWIDTSDFVPHGKGYRYFGIGSQSGLFDSGVQVAYISAANVV